MFHLSLKVGKEDSTPVSPLPLEYKKSLEDEIDWKIIDQLHAATINFSSASIKMKRIFVMMLALIVTILNVLKVEDFLQVLLNISIVLTFVFWMLDSITYYYQEELREKMNKLFAQISQRNRNVVTEQSYVLNPERTNKYRGLRSLFNLSHAIYYIFLIAEFLFILFKLL